MIFLIGSDLLWRRSPIDATRRVGSKRQQSALQIRTKGLTPSHGDPTDAGMAPAMQPSRFEGPPKPGGSGRGSP